MSQRSVLGPETADRLGREAKYGLFGRLRGRAGNVVYLAIYHRSQSWRTTFMTL